MPPETVSDSALSRELLRETRTAALATLNEAGGPFASYVTVAPSPDGTPLLYLSRLAVHTRNLERDPRASLLLVRAPPPSSEALTAVRLTLTGEALKDLERESLRLFVSRHPEAGRYASFADFSLYRFKILSGHLVAGFGRIVDLTPAELLGSG